MKTTVKNICMKFAPTLCSFRCCSKDDGYNEKHMYQISFTSIDTLIEFCEMISILCVLYSEMNLTLCIHKYYEFILSDDTIKKGNTKMVITSTP